MQQRPKSKSNSFNIQNAKKTSITQQFSPRYRSTSQTALQLSNLQQNEKQKYENALDYHKKLNQVIERLQKIFTNRMSVHEEELLAIMKKQINIIVSDAQKIVEKSHRQLQPMGIDDKMYFLENQVQFFKAQAHRLYQENLELTRKNKKLKQQLEAKTVMQQCQNSLMMKLNKKIKKNNLKLQQGTQDQHTRAHRIKHYQSLQSLYPHSVSLYSKSHNVTQKTKYRTLQNYTESLKKNDSKLVLEEDQGIKNNQQLKLQTNYQKNSVKAENRSREKQITQTHMQKSKKQLFYMKKPHRQFKNILQANRQTIY